jgi:hypothetical protein
MAASVKMSQEPFSSDRMMREYFEQLYKLDVSAVAPAK